MKTKWDKKEIKEMLLEIYFNDNYDGLKKSDRKKLVAELSSSKNKNIEKLLEKHAIPLDQMSQDQEFFDIINL